MINDQRLARTEQGGSGCILSVRNLMMSFGGLKAINGVSFDVAPKTVLTLIGPNGAGKTTVFNLISRIYSPTSGSIDYQAADGALHQLVRFSAHQIAALGIARTFQNIELFEKTTVLQNLLIGEHARARTTLWQDLLFTGLTRRREIEARERVEEVIDFLNLQHYREALVEGLPYGVRKVVELGRALCLKPRLLLLDEPSSGLNAEETDEMAFWISDIRDRLGVTIVMVEHDMSLVSKVSDHVVAMHHGQLLASGTAGQVQSDPAVIQAYLGDFGNATPLHGHAS